jgi:methyltransferase-like protein
VKTIPPKSEINKKRKPDLISLLKEIIDQFNTSLVGDTNGEAQVSAQGPLLSGNISGQEVATETLDAGTQQPIRIESVTWMKAKNTNKTQLKVQLQLYGTLVTDVPTSQEQQKMNKAQLSEALVAAFTKYQATTRE